MRWKSTPISLRTLRSISRLLLKLSFWLRKSRPKSELLDVNIIGVVGAIVVWLFINIASRASWDLKYALWQFSIDKPPATLIECLICPVLSAILQGKHCMKKMVMERLWKSKLQIKLTDKFHTTVQLCIFQFLDATYNIYLIRISLLTLLISTLLNRGRHLGKSISNPVFPRTWWSDKYQSLIWESPWSSMWRQSQRREEGLLLPSTSSRDLPKTIIWGLSCF